MPFNLEFDIVREISDYMLNALSCMKPNMAMLLWLRTMFFIHFFLSTNKLSVAKTSLLWPKIFGADNKFSASYV